MEEQYPTVQCQQKICLKHDLLRIFVKTQSLQVQIVITKLNSPSGLVSKNNIGVRRIALNILLCRLRDALRQVK